MKKKYLFAEFVLVFLFFLLPPLFATGSSGPAFVFSKAILLQAAVSILLDVQHHKLSVIPQTAAEDPASQKQQKFKKLIAVLTWFAVSLGLLMLSFALFTVLGSFFPKFSTSSETQIPSGSSQWILLIVNLTVSAYYEEIIYRQFTPITLRYFSRDKKPLHILSEVLTILFFAFAHRYLGPAAVLNALVCGIILRLCYIKTDGPYTGFAVHLLYNLIMYIFAYSSSLA